MPMHDLGHTLNSMDSTRLLLALLFVASYASSIGRLATERGRHWSIALATLAGLAFVGLTDPWVHGVLLVIFAVVGVGAFIALAWAFSVWAARRQVSAATPLPQAAEMPSTVPEVLVGRRVRRIRRRLSTL